MKVAVSGKMLGLGLSVLTGFSLTGLAQEPPDARQQCEEFANTFYQSYSPGTFDRIMLFQNDLSEEKYEAKAGSQFVSTVLSGTGLILGKTGNASDIRFTCLLENSEKPVFFHLTEDPLPDPVMSCAARFDTIGEAVPCLEKTLQDAETKLSRLEARAETDAKAVLTHWPQAKTTQALIQSNADWKKYRDNECARRLAFYTGGNHPDIPRLGCLIQKTRERIMDLSGD